MPAIQFQVPISVQFQVPSCPQLISGTISQFHFFLHLFMTMVYIRHDSSFFFQMNMNREKCFVRKRVNLLANFYVQKRVKLIRQGLLLKTQSVFTSFPAKFSSQVVANSKKCSLPLPFPNCQRTSQMNFILYKLHEYF